MTREKRAVPKKPCCMVSEALEEMGLDRERARQVRRQVLEGLILMCQWQLQRMEERRAEEAAGPRARSRGRKVEVE